MGQGGADHAHDIAEVVEHHHGYRQHELRGERPAGVGIERRGAGQDAEQDDEDGLQEDAAGEFRHRGGDDADDRYRAVEARRLAHPGCDAEDDRGRHDDPEGESGQDQRVAEAIPDDLVDRMLEARRVAEEMSIPRSSSSLRRPASLRSRG